MIFVSKVLKAIFCCFEMKEQSCVCCLVFVVVVFVLGLFGFLFVSFCFNTNVTAKRFGWRRNGFVLRERSQYGAKGLKTVKCISVDELADDGIVFEAKTSITATSARVGALKN